MRSEAKEAGVHKGKITTKKTMYRLLNRGRFGNVYHSWGGWEEVLRSGYRGLLSVRSGMTIADPIRMYDVPFQEVQDKIDYLPPDLIFYEATDTSSRIINGEVTRGINGWDLYYSVLPLHMRPALEVGGKHAHGAVASIILGHLVDPTTLDDIREIMGDFNDPIVEFTSFSKPVGKLNRMSVIWEVRHY